MPRSRSVTCSRVVLCSHRLTARAKLGYDDGSIVDFHVGHLAHKIDPSHAHAHSEGRRSSVSEGRRSSVTAPSEGRADHAADATPAPVMHVRPKGAHVGSSIVALCVPKENLKPDLLVSCSCDKGTAVWSSQNDYHTYPGHAGGARYHASCALLRPVALTPIAPLYSQLRRSHIYRSRQWGLAGHCTVLRLGHSQ